MVVFVFDCQLDVEDEQLEDNDGGDDDDVTTAIANAPATCKAKKKKKKKKKPHVGEHSFTVRLSLVALLDSLCMICTLY